MRLMRVGTSRCSTGNPQASPVKKSRGIATRAESFSPTPPPSPERIVLRHALIHGITSVCALPFLSPTQKYGDRSVQWERVGKIIHIVNGISTSGRKAL